MINDFKVIGLASKFIGGSPYTWLCSTSPRLGLGSGFSVGGEVCWGILQLFVVLDPNELRDIMPLGIFFAYHLDMLPMQLLCAL